MKYIKTQLFSSAPNSMKVAKQLTKKFGLKGEKKRKISQTKVEQKKRIFRSGLDFITLSTVCSRMVDFK